MTLAAISASSMGVTSWTKRQGICFSFVLFFYVYFYRMCFFSYAFSCVVFLESLFCMCIFSYVLLFYLHIYFLCKIINSTHLYCVNSITIIMILIAM